MCIHAVAEVRGVTPIKDSSGEMKQLLNAKVTIVMFKKLEKEIPE